MFSLIRSRFRCRNLGDFKFSIFNMRFVFCVNMDCFHDSHLPIHDLGVDGWGFK